ncbi:hypothetical protein BAZSYMA_ACONTIG03627_13 [Bathymodiolus azoricus thioautotrophic gill symbiont]|uniref:Uncharacterized protein n=1 Tax=Bathymodiolus azoricus thioautotrophic gill symbiont TaxID=235205 RepID=A0A1H6JWY6_9GAMM|nr:hypothetical protein BAZSYMA_ACONTIG03627_13 [Bathymodiolus azoricus thioautotrophic gill symbiont]
MDGLYDAGGVYSISGSSSISVASLSASTSFSFIVLSDFVTSALSISNSPSSGASGMSCPVSCVFLLSS